MQRALILFTTLALAACHGSSKPEEDASVADMAVQDMITSTGGDMVTGPCTAGTGTCAAVATSTYNADFTGMGTLDVVDTATKKVTLNIDATLDPDTTLRMVNGELFVLMRDSGSVRIYDPSTYQVKVELPVGDTMNPSGSAYPQDFFVDGNGKIWVTLSGNDSAHAVGILDRTQPGSVTYVTVPTVAGDNDGKPEANKLYACSGTLWVTTQNYTYNSGTMMVTYKTGRLVPIDPGTQMAGSPVALTGQDPSDITPFATDCTDALVVTSSSTTTPPDGNGDLERVNLTTGVVSQIAPDTTLGGRPVLIVVNNGTAFIAEYFDPQPNGMGATYLASVKLIAYDLTANTQKDVTGKFGNINFLQLQGGNLYFGAGVYSAMEDPSKLPRGLYITPADGTMLTASPIDLQLTPSAIALP